MKVECFKSFSDLVQVGFNFSKLKQLDPVLFQRNLARPHNLGRCKSVAVSSSL